MPEKPVVAVEEPLKGTPQELVDVTPAAPKASVEEELAAKIKADFEQLYGSRLAQVEKQFENFRHTAYRKQEESERENAQLKQQLQQVQVAAPVLPTSDPWATIQDGSRWKQTIEQLAEQKAEEKLKTWQLEQANNQRIEQFRQVRNWCIEQVSSKYPDLHPETGTGDSPVSKAYKSVVDSKPELFQDAYGPIAAMYLMEEQLKANPAAKPSPPSVASKASLASLPPSLQAVGKARQTITREQKEFCDYHGIKYEDYLKNAATLETTGGLET